MRVLAWDGLPHAVTPDRYTADLNKELARWGREYRTVLAGFDNTGGEITWQPSTVNGTSIVSALPNGSSTNAVFRAYGNSDTTAAQAAAQFAQNGTATVVNAVTLNSGTQGTIELRLNSVTKFAVQTNGDVTVGPGGSQAMTAGFIYVPAGTGAPSGTPTTRSGFVPLYLDRTNKQLYYYDGAWFKSAAFT